MGGSARTAFATTLCALAFAGIAPAAPAQIAPPNTDWTSLLPARPGNPLQPQPGSYPFCEQPSIACVDAAMERLRALRERFGCDHRGVFATTYLELTRELRRRLDRDPGLFADPGYLYTEDALFADVYLRTVEAWERGDDVAPAWRISFEGAAGGQLTGAQEMLLGINAHVQNDMPFVLAELGLREPDGDSRKPDHEVMNDVLNTAYDSVVFEVGSRFDPTMSLTNPEALVVDDVGGLEAARGWRELVWRNAERLLAARTDAQRALVARSIEANAALWARAISAVPVPGISGIRDEHCAAHWTP
jgi:Family of unknown function (DUF5995)